MKNFNILILNILIIAFTVSCSKDDNNDNSGKGLGMFSVTGAVTGDFNGAAVFDNFLGVDRIKIYDLENNAILTLVPQESPTTGQFSIGDIFDGDYNANFEYFPDGNPDNGTQYFSDVGTITITTASASEIKANFEFTTTDDGNGSVEVSGSFHALPD